MHKPRVFIADDHPLIVEGFRQLIVADTVIVGTAYSGRELLAKAPGLTPDIVLLDVSMPDMNGLDLAPLLKQRLPRVKIIFVTMLSEPFYVSEGFQRGANGYLLKQSVSSELLSAIRTVMSDCRYVSPDVAADIREVIQLPWTRPEGYHAQLTSREREVVRIFSDGLSVKAIAKTMGISVRTVEFHKAGIMKKLGLKNASDLTKFALAQGMTKL